jgi:hypothetical protein
LPLTTSCAAALNVSWGTCPVSHEWECVRVSSSPLMKRRGGGGEKMFGWVLTSVMGMPSVGCGIVVEDGICVPWMKTTAPRASSADHMGSYTSPPMYTTRRYVQVSVHT